MVEYIYMERLSFIVSKFYGCGDACGQMIINGVLKKLG
jgi:hypothetical protein